MENWPKYYNNQLIINSPKGVAIICGWTKKEIIWNNLSDNAKSKVSVLGQLYSKEGINFIIRNLFLSPHINYIVITGEDISGSIVSFKDFLSGKEVDFIHEEIPQEKVNQFKEYFSKNSAFININDIDNFLKDFDEEKTPKAWTNETFDFPDHIPEKKDKLPSEEVGFRIEGKRIAEVWVNVLKTIDDFGFEKMSSYGEKQKELINIITVIDGEDPDCPFIPDYLNFSQASLLSYYPQMMTDDVFPGVEYTYGSRLRNHKGINQIGLIIKELQKENFSRRGIAVTWDVEKDSENSKSPCLILVQSLIQDNKIYFTAYLRSNDMFRAWPQNAFGLLKIQKEIAQGLEIGLGKLTIISSSAHIYERDFLETKKVLKNTKYSFEKDPRGMFLIEVDKKEIIVKHADRKGQTIQEFRGKSAEDLRRRIVNFVSRIDHALYLGAELLRAEKSIKDNKPFIQDEDSYKHY